MNALDIARQKIATLEADGGDAINERNEENQPPGNYLVSLVYRVPSAAPQSATNATALMDAYASAAGEDRSSRLLSALTALAARGDQAAAQEAGRLADHLEACDRGEVVIPAHPNEPALKAWNDAVWGLAKQQRQKAEQQKRKAA